MSKFQIILTGIFVFCIVIGVIAFATFKSNNTTSQLPTITIWGTLPATTFTEFVNQLNKTRTSILSVNYVQIPETDFRRQFIEELANGRGPDAILVPQQYLLGLNDKIVEIPNTVLSQRAYQDTFIGQSGLYITQTGFMAIPFFIDPLVMYWNRTMFTNAGIAKYPVYWDEFAGIGKKIDVKDVNSNIRRSSIAMGEFVNIDHAREILSTLFLQAGNPITFYGTSGIQSGLGDSSYSGSKTSTPALTFFTQFSDPRDSHYSWNRSLPSSKNSFLAGTLATYFGFASEVNELRQKNPNIDYDVAPMPQARTGSVRTTYGDMYGISIVRSSLNQGNTYNIMQILTAPDAMAILSKITFLPSVRRDVIAQGSTNPYMASFLDAALISRGWLDADPVRSNQIFTNMVQSVTSGRLDTYTAIKNASDELNLSLQNK
jgi:ABC-type glycerol-3-phosphate transport system substrate-binding protein